MTVFDRWSKDVDERMICSLHDARGASLRHLPGRLPARWRQHDRRVGTGEHLATRRRLRARDAISRRPKTGSRISRSTTRNTSTTAPKTSSTTTARSSQRSSCSQLPATTRIATPPTSDWAVSSTASTPTGGSGLTTRRPAVTCMRQRPACRTPCCCVTSRCSPASDAALLAGRAAGGSPRSPTRARRQRVGDNPFGYPRQYVLVPGKPGSRAVLHGAQERERLLVARRERAARLARVRRPMGFARLRRRRAVQRRICGAMPRRRSTGSSG